MSKTTKRKFPTLKSLIEDSPWEIAKKFGVHYFGDMCPVPHGGYWYETNHWREHGYATAIEISESEGTLWVEERTINKHDDLAAVLRHSGIDPAVEYPDEVEIEAYMAYGSECDRHRRFVSDNGKGWGNFPERKTMKAVQEFWPCLMGE